MSEPPFQPPPEDVETPSFLSFLTNETSYGLKLSKELEASFGIDLVEIPSGEFWMGSTYNERRPRRETPQHLVQLSSFYIGKYPITQAQWRKVAALPKITVGLNPDSSYFRGDDLPVEEVTWYEVMEFCNRLSQYTGYTYRLPSEAEWEYACRAYTSTDNSFGVALTKSLANFGYNYPGTTPVGSFPPNAFGLYDMHGNVYEWCLDHWHSTYQGAPKDGSAWVDEEDGENKFRVIRGGSWNEFAKFCRSACRSFDFPHESFDFIGFRVVREKG